MCRVYLRKNQNNNAPANQQPALDPSPSLYEAMKALSEDNNDLNDFSSGNIDTESHNEIDDEFLNLLQSTAPTVPEAPQQIVPAEEPNMSFVNTDAVYMGQPATYTTTMPHQQNTMMGMPIATAPASYSHQQQMMAAAPPPPMYAYQMMQQQQAQTAAYMQQTSATMSQQQHQTSTADLLARPPQAPRSYKRNKTAEEAAIQEEMVKKRRRESAARSRQRKACYMHQLEIENNALKLENDRLRAQLAKAVGMPSSQALMMAPPVSATTRSSSMKVDNSGATYTEQQQPVMHIEEQYLFAMPTMPAGIPMM